MLDIKQIRAQAPKGATHYANTSNGEVIYMEIKGRVVKLMQRPEKGSQIFKIKPLH